MLEITAIHAFSDNYIWCIHDSESKQAIVVDPGSAEVVESFLSDHHLNLCAILITHHHFDHIGGIASLKKDRKLDIYGFRQSTIPFIDHPVSEGDHFTLLNCAFNVIEVPGHTLDHIAYFAPNSAMPAKTADQTPWLFCGDTLFSGGCGRLFEGSPSQMNKSLSKLADLPANTEVYCAHEYTLSNLAFALTFMPNNTDLQTYFVKCQNLRQLKTPTIPSTIKIERKINPFFKTDDEELISIAKQQNPDLALTSEAIFAALRKAKDCF